MEDTIADLFYISEYAQALRNQLKAGMQPNLVLLARMAELSANLQRKFDPKYAEWCEFNDTNGR